MLAGGSMDRAPEHTTAGREIGPRHDAATVAEAAGAWPLERVGDTFTRTHSSPPPMSHAAHSGPAILVAEDNDDQRALSVAILTAAGYRVLEAADGAEAVAVALRDAPGLVLMDVNMPGMSGWNAVRMLKENPLTLGIPIIVITGLDSDWDRDASIAAGCDEYLAKPVPPAKLLQHVRRFLPA